MLRVWGTRAGLSAALFAKLVLQGRAQQQSAMIGPRSPSEVAAVAPSPDWPDDGTMLALRSGVREDLRRTRDGGQPWHQEMGVEALAFSPTYAADRSILVSISALGAQNRADTEAGFPISADGGASSAARSSAASTAPSRFHGSGR
jgi:hypothetical protein